MGYIRSLLLVIVVIGAVHMPAHATEACMPSPCAGTGGDVDTKKCARLADWVATGTITRVVHHVEGEPLFKDFAEFVFTVTATEKGAVKSGREIRFQVGWCQSWLGLPKETSGKFRFFGLQLPADDSLPNQYLYFEPVRGAKAGV